MSSAELENLAKIGKLKREPPSARELAGLLKSAQARIADAGRAELSFDSRFDLAYSAAHALALYSLRRLGYRSATATWCSRPFNIPPDCRPKRGAYSPRRTSAAILPSMKAT